VRKERENVRRDRGNRGEEGRKEGRGGGTWNVKKRRGRNIERGGARRRS